MQNNEDTKKVIEQLKTISSPNKARTFLASRGCNCISNSMLKKAKDARKNVQNDKEIIENLKKSIRLLQEIEGKLYMIYPKCYCHHLKNISDDVPKSYCYCSEGWVKHFFETALEKNVNVEIEKSVRWGDEECQIRIDI